MKITEIKTTRFMRDWKEYLGMSFNLKGKALKPVNILVEVFTDEGVVGRSSMEPLQQFEAKLHKEVIPIVVGESPFNIEKMVSNYIDAFPGLWNLSGSTTPIAAVEIACWDIIGKKLGVPVYQLLGGKCREKVGLTAMIGIKDAEEMIQDAVMAVKQGYNTIKIKVGKTPPEDIEIIKSVREAIGNEVQLRIDPNQAWSLPTAMRIIKKTASCDPQFIEQPLPTWDVDGLAHLRKVTGVPIAVCEGLYSIYHILEYIKKQAIDFISTDPLRMGGISQVKKLCAVAQAAGINVVPHTAIDQITTAIWLHWIVSTPTMKYDCDLVVSKGVGSTISPNPIITAPFQNENGYVGIPTGTGIGVEIDRAKLNKKIKEYEDKRRQLEEMKERPRILPIS